jgi:hypothetical protein
VLGDGSRGHGARGGHRAVTGPGGGSWSHEARGGSGAALCQEMGDAGMCAHLVFRLDLEFVHGGIWSSGYRHSRRLPGCR